VPTILLIARRHGVPLQERISTLKKSQKGYGKMVYMIVVLIWLMRNLRSISCTIVPGPTSETFIGLLAGRRHSRNGFSLRPGS